MNAPRLGLVARYFHIDKVPALRRAGMSADDLADVMAVLAGSSPDELRQQWRLLDAEATGLALELMDEPRFGAQVAGLPFADGDVIVALGDSITDDSLSWASILQAVLRSAGRDVQVRNHGITGNTTSEAISRLDTIAAEEPQWVIQMLGTNDARRHARGLYQTTSHAETVRNLGILSTFVTTELGARYLRMTPPPTIDARVATWPGFSEENITWRSADVAAIAASVVAGDAPAIDLHLAFTRAGAGEHLLDDGVHPNAEGQKLVVREIVRALSPTD